MHPRKFVRDSVGFAVSQYLVRFLFVARGLVAARLLGPAGYGAWNAIMLLLEYGMIAPLGTQQGLDQAVPARIVDGDARRLDRVKRSGLFNILALTGLFVVGGLVYFARSAGQIRTFWGLGGVALALGCVALTNVAHYHLTLFRSHGNIAAVSTWFLIQGVVGVGLGLALIPWLGPWGLLWGWFAGTLASVVQVRLRGGAVAPLVPAPSRESLGLLAVGLPMFLFSASNFLMRSLDRVLILRFLGTEALGLYALAVIAVGFLLYLPDSIAYVLYPRLVRRFREAGDDPEAIRDAAHRAMRALSLVMPALCALAYLAADDAVGWLLPGFRAGVPSMRILCFSAAGLALANLGAIVLMTLGRHAVLVPAAAAMTLLGVTLDLYAIRAGLGIRGVAWATFVTYTLHGTLLLALANLGLLRAWWARLAFLARALLPLAAAILLAWALERFHPWSDRRGPVQLLRLLLAAAVFLGGYAMVAVPLARDLGLRQLVGEFRLPAPPWIRRTEASGG